MKRDFTATAYLIENQKVLLIYHKKLEKWLPPGGHIEENETPPEAAQREVLEETGFKFEFISQENIVIQRATARSLERPYMCLLEEIPAYGDTPSHQHVDFIFVGKPIGSIGVHSHSYRWFGWDELLKFKPDQEILQDTLDVIQQLFQDFSSPIEELALSAADYQR